MRVALGRNFVSHRSKLGPQRRVANCLPAATSSIWGRFRGHFLRVMGVMLRSGVYGSLVSFRGLAVTMLVRRATFTIVAPARTRAGLALPSCPKADSCSGAYGSSSPTNDPIIEPIWT